MNKPNTQSLPKPAKPQSRLAELAASKVVTAGEAFEHDLEANAPQEPKHVETVLEQDVPSRVLPPKKTAKRTFRYPRHLDAELKRVVLKFNLEKLEDVEDLSMEELGIIIAEHFLKSEPENIIQGFRQGPSFK